MRKGKKVIDDENLMSEWNFDRNDDMELHPQFLNVNSHEKVWWICKDGHEWEALIANRYRLNRGCPYCAHQKVLIGINDLKTEHPEIAKEWDYRKNIEKPEEVFSGSNKKIWWVCPKGHSYQAIIKSRKNGGGCPYCGGKKVLAGFNDLKSTNPELASEWNFSKNGDLTPEDVTANSGKKVWWICKNGHEWEASVDNRSKGRNCPICSKSLRTSFPEQAIYYYVKRIFPDAINGYKEIFKSSMELDIYIPSIKVGIEYDGALYHSKDDIKIRDAKKYNKCKQNGIRLIRVCESMRYTPMVKCDYQIDVPTKSSGGIDVAIKQLCNLLGHRMDVDTRRDRRQIQEYLTARRVSLADEFPMIAAEWNYELNQNLRPEQFPPHSNERVSWKCSRCGNEWYASIGDRTRKKPTGCPKCAGKVKNE